MYLLILMSFKRAANFAKKSVSMQQYSEQLVGKETRLERKCFGISEVPIFLTKTVYDIGQID